MAALLRVVLLLMAAAQLVVNRQLAAAAEMSPNSVEELLDASRIVLVSPAGQELNQAVHQEVDRVVENPVAPGFDSVSSFAGNPDLVVASAGQGASDGAGVTIEGASAGLQEEKKTLPVNEASSSSDSDNDEQEQE